MWLVERAKEAYRVWSDAKASQLSAAIAYYSAFSLAPIVLISMAVAGFFFGADAVRGQLEAQLRGVLGPEAAGALQDMIAASERSGSQGRATAVGVLLLAFAATGLFTQLKDSLNTIWGIAEKPTSAVLDFVKNRAAAFGMVLAIGFLLLVSLVASALLSAMADWIGRALPVPPALLQIAGSALTFAIVTVLFAAIFRVLPDAHIAWRDLWLGAAITAALFTIGKFGLAWYLGRQAAESGHSAAGAFVLVLLWVYYSSLILLFGAAVTRVVARARGARIRPSPGAVAVTPPGKERRLALERDRRGEPTVPGGEPLG